MKDVLVFIACWLAGGAVAVGITLLGLAILLTNFDDYTLPSLF